MVLGKRPAESQVSVGILESEWCTWLGAVSFAKFNIKWVILQTSAYLHIVRRRLPQTTIVVRSSQQVDWLLLSEVQMVFCDQPPGASSPIWKFPLLTDVVAWCRPRRPLVLKEFSLSKFHIRHDQVGGVSDFCAHILHYHSAQVAPICITPLCGGSVKTILDCTIASTWKRQVMEVQERPIKFSVLTRLPVPGLETTFSVEGLYPLKGTLRHPPNFVAP